QVSPTLMPMLAKVHLPRPVTNSIELTAVLSAAEAIKEFESGFEGPAPESEVGAKRSNARLLLYASKDEIVAALTKLCDATGMQRSVNRRFIRRGITYLMDYPEPHRGRLGGLVNKCIRWHQHRGWETHRSESGNRFKANVVTCEPPVARPKEHGVRMLENAAEIYAESERMHHCVAEYAGRCVWGGFFLFHVEYNFKRATVLVSPEGRVLQAQGPCNASNDAVAYGVKILTKWGRTFPRKRHRE
ncbi:MAG: PcfJ domain-containing protein, partial [Planctomycetota bacterium]